MIWVMLKKTYGLNAAYGCYAACSTYLAGLRVVCGQFAFLYGWYTAVKLLAMVRAGIDYVYMERIYQYSYYFVFSCGCTQEVIFILPGFRSYTI